jgi:RND superfamily putative drug exporter
VAAELGPGANGPFVAVVRGSGPAAAATVARTVAALDRDPGVAGVAQPVATPDRALTVVAAEPSTAPTDERTVETMQRLRATLPDDVELTGWTPFLADISALLGERLWWVIGFVVAVSFLLLMVMFRSVVVPAKAALLNVLSISGAYGVLTAVFQWGWGGGLIGLDGTAHVSSWMPILMFAILFGLSMDYEVFLLSRVREDYLRTGDPRGSVVRGLAASGRVITSAAVIMVAVFLGFASESDVVVKQLGLGMAAAIALDATVVRMVLVPATMVLLGHANWWLPRWLDRLLPGTPVPPGRPTYPHRVPAPAADEHERELVGGR